MASTECFARAHTKGGGRRGEPVSGSASLLDPVDFEKEEQTLEREQGCTSTHKRGGKMTRLEHGLLE